MDISGCQNKNAINNFIVILQDLCAYYKKDPFQIQMIFGGLMPTIQFDRNGQPEKGIRNILTALVDFEERLERFAVEGWAEFCIRKFIYSNGINEALKEMNDIVKSRVYLVGYKLSAADVLVYFFLYDLMLAMNPRDKIKYIHVCRWFDHVQREPNMRMRQRQLIHFDRIVLCV